MYSYCDFLIDNEIKINFKMSSYKLDSHNVIEMKPITLVWHKTGFHQMQAANFR